MSSVSPLRPKNFREKVFFRELRTQVDGNAKVEYGLTQIKGVGMRFAQAIVRVAKINPNIRIGAIPEKDLNRIEEIVLNPIKNGVPNWMVNRKKDLRRGVASAIIRFSSIRYTMQLDIPCKHGISNLHQDRTLGCSSNLHL